MKTLNRWTDQKLESLTELIESIEMENIYQLNKWGVQTRSSFEWYCYLGEEVGELSKAISEFEYRRGPFGNIFNEAIQVATLALKIAEMAREKARGK